VLNLLWKSRALLCNRDEAAVLGVPKFAIVEFHHRAESMLSQLVINLDYALTRPANSQ